MTWHLKNKTLEEELCRMYPGFLEALNHAAELSIGCTNYVAVEFNRELDNSDTHENHLVFLPDELEVVYEYNPNDWNEFATVKPPKDVWMRIEDKDGWGTKAKWNGNNWINFAYDTISCTPRDKLRFRPWED